MESGKETIFHLQISHRHQFPDDVEKRAEENRGQIPTNFRSKAAKVLLTLFPNGCKPTEEVLANSNTEDPALNGCAPAEKVTINCQPAETDEEMTSCQPEKHFPDNMTTGLKVTVLNDQLDPQEFRKRVQALGFELIEPEQDTVFDDARHQ
jgi:hypothetical protein